MASVSPLDELEKLKILRSRSLDILEAQIEVLSNAGRITPDVSSNLCSQLVTLRKLAPLYEELSYALKNGTLFRELNMPTDIVGLEVKEKAELSALLQKATSGFSLLRISSFFSASDERRPDIGVSIDTVKAILHQAEDVLGYDGALRTTNAPVTRALAESLTEVAAQSNYRAAEQMVREARNKGPDEFKQAVEEYKSTMAELFPKAPSPA